MNTKLINDMLSNIKKTRYDIRIGESIEIIIPNIKLTKFTKFVQLKAKLTNNEICEIKDLIGLSKKDFIFPQKILIYGIKEGLCRLIIDMFDITTNKKIKNIHPIEIIIRVKK